MVKQYSGTYLQKPINLNNFLFWLLLATNFFILDVRVGSDNFCDKI